MRPKLKPHWDERAKEFRFSCLLITSQVDACFFWCEAHRSGKGKAPDELELLKMMDAADAEGAAWYVRHFLWTFFHYPERIIAIKVR